MHGHNHEHHIGGDMTAEELYALMKYNYTHNCAHINQMDDMLEKLKALGKSDAAEKLRAAVEGYREANALLKESIEKLK